MTTTRDGRAIGGTTPVQDDLRHRVAALLVDRADIIVADAVGMFPYSSPDEGLDASYCAHVARSLIHVLTTAVRDGRISARNPGIADVHQAVRERHLLASRLSTFAYLVERTALDDLAADASIGATTEPWASVAQIVRHASFDVLGAYAERVETAAGDSAIVDALTSVHTRALFDVVLAREAERAGRYGYPISLILFDVDDLALINREYGQRVGDRVLERLGVLIRKYFRHHDWVARHGADSFAVVLTRADADHAEDLADRVRATVADRLGSADRRTDRPLRVTVTAAIVTTRPSAGETVDPERLLSDAEAALAKAQGARRAAGSA